MTPPNPFRRLPAVSQALTAAGLADARSRYSPQEVTAAVRAAVARLRDQLAAQEPLPDGDLMPSLVEDVLARLADGSARVLRPVINATGIVLHTNLGRSPLHEAAAKAAYDAACGYLNLELDLVTGERSSRQDAIRAGVCKLTGAEAATAVNNCAAATILALRVVAAGREVIVSRGQLVEIGGSFRIPEILAASGATLREVGTTNVTRASDYEKAVGPNTAAILRVHASNFRVRGFTQAVGLDSLVGIGRRHGLPVIDDVGSGLAVAIGFPGEPHVRASVAAGADLVLFSGDKLLGGPQAGIVAGRKGWVDRMEADPLMRAFRLDKMALAALEATLDLYRDPARAVVEVPTLRMLSTPREELRTRAEGFARRLQDANAAARFDVREDVGYAGGGSLPDQAMPTAVIAVEAPGVGDAELARRLRVGTPAVLGRVQGGTVLLDLRTVLDWQEDDLFRAVGQALT